VSRRAHNFVDMTGQRFGRLVALSPVVKSGSKGGRERVFWRCKCDCGNGIDVEASALSRGDARSCKCLQREMTSERSKTHGRKRTRAYRIWIHIKTRCLNPNIPGWHLYGGRGITVCPEWVASFEAFHSHMGDPPTGVHSIDRIENDLGYFPGNCRWATPKQQGRNQRTNVLVEFYGRQVCLSEAAELAGINYGTVYHRIFKHGWSADRALRTPARRMHAKAA
jgi:hypothetical protein